MRCRHRLSSVVPRDHLGHAHPGMRQEQAQEFPTAETRTSKDRDRNRVQARAPRDSSSFSISSSASSLP